MSNPYAHIVEPLNSQKPEYKFFNLRKLGDPRYGKRIASDSLHFYLSCFYFSFIYIYIFYHSSEHDLLSDLIEMSMWHQH